MSVKNPHGIVPSPIGRIPGVFKIELPNEIITHVVCAAPKLYAIKTTESELKRIKGCVKSVRREIDFATFVDVWKGNKVYSATMYGFRNFNHVLETVKYQKSCITFKNDKRYFDGDSVFSLALGHYRIPLVALSNMDASTSLTQHL